MGGLRPPMPPLQDHAGISRAQPLTSWLVSPALIASSIIVLYLALCLALGLLSHSRLLPGSLEDFFLYGRRAKFLVLYLTIVSTYHSAFAFLGSVGYFYRHGIGFWAAGSWTILTGLLTWILGGRAWALGKRFGYITPAEMAGDFYTSRTVRMAIATVSVLFTITYIQVQSLGLGYILSVASGDRIPFALACGVPLAVTAAYLLLGGVRAVYWTDVLQGVWMYVAVWTGGLFLAVYLFGGVGPLWDRVSLTRPELLTLPGPLGQFTYLHWFSLVVIFSFGVVLQPHFFLKFFTAESGRTLRRLGATTPIYLMTLYIPTAWVGLGAAVVRPGSNQPDALFPELLLEHAPAWLAGFILAGAAAAAMSTLSGILHANMTVLSRDLFQGYLRPQASGAQAIRFGRWCVVLITVLGFVLTMVNPGFLVQLVAISGAGALQLLPAVLGNLFPRRIRFARDGVLAGLAVGLATLCATLFGLGEWLAPHPLGLHAGLWGLIANATTVAALSRAAARGPRAAVVESCLAEFADAREPLFDGEPK